MIEAVVKVPSRAVPHGTFYLPLPTFQPALKLIESLVASALFGRHAPLH